MRKLHKFSRNKKLKDAVQTSIYQSVPMLVEPYGTPGHKTTKHHKTVNPPGPVLVNTKEQSQKSYVNSKTA